MLDEHDYSSRREVSEMCNQLSDAQGRAMETMHFFQWNTPSSRTEEKEKKVGGELDGQIGTWIFRGERESKKKKYLEGRKDEISSLATEASENTRRRRIIESVAKKSAEQNSKGGN